MSRTTTALLLCLLTVAGAAGAVTVPWGEPWAPETGVTAFGGPLLAPFAVYDQSGSGYSYGYPYTIKFDDWGASGYPSAGNILLIDLGNGNKVEQIAGTVDNIVTIGEFVYSFTGNNVGSLKSGLTERLTPSAYQLDHNNADYVSGDNYRAWEQDGFPLDARVVVCPVVSGIEINGRKELFVSGFTAFYADRYDPTAVGDAQKMVSLMFVSAMSPDIVAVSTTPEPSSLLALLFGVGSLSLAFRRRASADC